MFIPIIFWLYLNASLMLVIAQQDSTTCETIKSNWSHLYAKSSKLISTKSEKSTISNTIPLCHEASHCCERQKDALAAQFFHQLWMQTYREPLLKQAAAFENASSYFYNFFTKCLDTFWYELDANFNRTYEEFYIRRRHVFVTFHTSLKHYLDRSILDVNGSRKWNKQGENKSEKLSDVLKSVFGLLLYNIMEAVDNRRDFNSSKPELNTATSDMSRCLVTALTENPEIFKPIKMTWDPIDAHMNRAIPVVRVFINSLAVVKEEVEVIVNHLNPSTYAPCMQRMLQLTHCYRCHEHAEPRIPPCVNICRDSVNEACIGAEWIKTFTSLLQHLHTANGYLKQPFNFVNIIRHLPNDISSLIMSIQNTILQHFSELQEMCKTHTRSPRIHRRWSASTQDSSLEEEYYRHMKDIQLVNEASKLHLSQEPGNGFHETVPPTSSLLSPAMLESALNLQLRMMQNVVKPFEQLADVVCNQFSEGLNPDIQDVVEQRLKMKCWNGSDFISSKLDTPSRPFQTTNLPDIVYDSQRRLSVLIESLQQVITRMNMSSEPSLVLLRKPLPLKTHALPFVGLQESSKQLPESWSDISHRKPPKDSEEGSGFVSPKFPPEENRKSEHQVGQKDNKRMTSRIYSTTPGSRKTVLVEDDEDQATRARSTPRQRTLLSSAFISSSTSSSTSSVSPESPLSSTSSNTTRTATSPSSCCSPPLPLVYFSLLFLLYELVLPLSQLRVHLLHSAVCRRPPSSCLLFLLE